MNFHDENRAERLVALALKRFDPALSDAELKILRDSASSTDLLVPAADAPRPSIRADFLRWLVTDPEATPDVDQKGLRAYGVTVPGKLDLRRCKVLVFMDFQQSTLQGEIDLLSAEFKGMSIQRCSLEAALSAEGSNVQGPLFLRKTTFLGGIRLLRAKIHSDLDLSGSKIRSKTEFGIDAEGAEIGGHVYLNRSFESQGAIRLSFAFIKGVLDCRDAKIEVKSNVEGAVALNAESIEIGGKVRAQGLAANGRVNFRCARIKGDLDFEGATLDCKDFAALSVDSATIGGNLNLSHGFKSVKPIRLNSAQIQGQVAIVDATLGKVQCSGLDVSGDFLWMGLRNPEAASLDLTGAKVKNLRDDENSWPRHPKGDIEFGNLILDGLRYEELSLHESPTQEQIRDRSLSTELRLSARSRIAWLMRQSLERRMEPQPWIYLSKHLEAKGDREGAKRVLFELRRLQAREERKWQISRLWAISFAWLEESPLRILWPITVTLLLGTLIFAGAFRDGAMIESFRIKHASNNIGDSKVDSAPSKAADDFSGFEVEDEEPPYPPFQPFIYVLENSVPLVKLGMDDKWVPDPQYIPKPWFPDYPGLKWLGFNYWFLAITRWLLILLGWFQATVLAAAISGRFKQ